MEEKVVRVSELMPVDIVLVRGIFLAPPFKGDVLNQLPKSRFFKNKIRMMYSFHFRHLPFLKKVGEGRLIADDY